MKSYFLVVIIALAIGAFASFQMGCSRQPANSNAVAAATPEPTPDKAAIEAELMKIENDWPRVMKERDAQAVRRIDADDAYLLGWDGSVATKDEDAKFIESGALAANSMEMGDLQVRVLDKDVAVVTGAITIKGGSNKAQNKTVELSGQYRFVDTFARRNGQWQLIATASVKVQVPAATAPTPKTSPAAAASPVMKPSPATNASPRPKPSPPRPAASPAKTAVSPIKTP